MHLAYKFSRLNLDLVHKGKEDRLSNGNYLFTQYSNHNYTVTKNQRHFFNNLEFFSSGMFNVFFRWSIIQHQRSNDHRESKEILRSYFTRVNT